MLAGFTEEFSTQWGEINNAASALNNIRMISVSKYLPIDKAITRFDKLLPLCEINTNETMKMHLFHGIFPNNIRGELYQKWPTTYTDAHTNAIRYYQATQMLKIDKGQVANYHNFQSQNNC